MNLELEVRTIKEAPFFTGMEPQKMRLLACMSEQVSLADGETLYCVGDTPDAAYILLAGQVEFVDEHGNVMERIGRKGAGTMIGEVAILCEDHTHGVSARAIGDVSAMRLRRDDIFQLMKDCPRFSMAIARELAHRVRDLAKVEGRSLIN